MGGTSPESQFAVDVRTRPQSSSAASDGSRGLDLGPTRELHRWLQAELPRRGADYARELAHANETLHRQKITFGGARDIPTGLTALLLQPADVEVLDSAARTLHRLVEKTLDWLAESPERISQHLPHLRRIIPYLHSTRGWSGKQVVSRYDAVATPGGELKIIELNTCCPAGFLHSEAFCRATQHALAALDPKSDYEQLSPGAIDPDALVSGLLQIEQAAAIEPRMIAALTDENQIFHELDLLAAAVRRQTSRPMEILDARHVEFQGGQLKHNGNPISLTYNKFRISVPTSQNHCWRDGFEQRYAAYLQAVEQGAVVSVNNMFGMAVSEDKGLLALWSDPEVARLLENSWTNTWFGRARSRRRRWNGAAARSGFLIFFTNTASILSLNLPGKDGASAWSSANTPTRKPGERPAPRGPKPPRSCRSSSNRCKCRWSCAARAKRPSSRCS
jgi:hypothetical protein